MPVHCTSRTTLLTGIAVALIVALLVLVFHQYGNDDPFITFRYVNNLIAGKGFVYNVGEPVLSTTTPGYTLCLAALGLVYPDIPLLGNVFSAIGLGLGAMALYLWACAEREPLVGWAAGLLLLTFPLLVTTFGSEMCLYIGLALLGLYLHVAGRSVWGLAVVALATLIRPDGLLVAALIVLHGTLTERGVPWVGIAIYGLVLLPWIVYGTWTFGSPVPATLAAKRAQGQMSVRDSYVWGAWKIAQVYARWPLYALFLPLAAIGTWQIVTQRRTWLLVLTWALCHFAAYALLGVSRYFWYYAPLIPGAVVSVAAGLDWIRARLASRRATRRWQWVAVVSLLVCLLWPNIQALRYATTHPDPRLGIYRQAGEWIDRNLPAGTSLGTLEIGIIGYYAQRRMIDFAGLIQPEVHAQMGPGTTFQDSASWAVGYYRPDHLLLNPDWFSDWQDTLLRSCEPLHTFVHAQYDGELVLYRCDWSP